MAVVTKPDVVRFFFDPDSLWHPAKPAYLGRDTNPHPPEYLQSCEASITVSRNRTDCFMELQAVGRCSASVNNKRLLQPV